MDVKRIDEPGRDWLVLGDLQPGDHFVFRSFPNEVRQRLANNQYICVDDWTTIDASPGTLTRHVIHLELAHTDGQTLLLRRAE